MRLSRGRLALTATLFSTMASGAAFAADPTGIWFNDTGRGAVEIKPCGKALCGAVIWVKDTGDREGCGRQILGDVPAAGDNVWDGGWIYSPERKKRYDVELRPLDGDRLQVTGYAGTKLFSKTMIWTRAPDNIIRCGTEAAAASPAPAASAKPEAKTASTMVPTSTTAEKPAAPAPAPAATAAAAKPDEKPPVKVAENSDEPAGDRHHIREALGEFLKKDGRGNCNLDTPWVKLNFKCEK